MNEQKTDSPQSDGPQWVPYQPPPPSGGERVWATVRRMAFPVILLLFMAGLGVLLFLSSEGSLDMQSLRELAGMEAAPTASVERAPSPAAGTTAMGGSATNPSGMRDGRTGPAEAGGGRLGTGYANLSVFSEPAGASVLIDGDSVGTTPLNRYSIQSGVYIITVRRDSFFAADTVAVLRNNQAPTYSVTLNPRPPLPDDAPALADRAGASSSPNAAGSEATAADRSASTPASVEEASPPASSESDRASTQESTPSTQVPPPEPAPTTGTLRFASTPEGARVQLDGEPVGTTPFALDDVEAGTHTVVFTRQGHDTLRTQVTLAPTEERTVQGALTPRPGRLRVLARPWGSIYIDGVLRERNADVWYETTVEAGTHEIEVIHPALGRQSRSVTVDAGEQLSIVIDLRSPSPDQDGVADTVRRDTTRGSNDPS